MREFYGICKDGLESAILYHVRKSGRFAYHVLDQAKMQSGITGMTPEDCAIDRINDAINILEDVLGEVEDRPEVYAAVDEAQRILIALTD